jgi:transcriptional regulator GlxA family with amidase domain
MTRQSVPHGPDPRHVSLVALPDAVVSTLTGIFNVMNAFALMGVANTRAGAQEVARLFALQWHQDGLTPYIVFEGKCDHGDGDIQSAQQWLDHHFSVAHPVEEMIKRSRLAERTFKRRFSHATGLAPLVYVQRLRIEDAKRRLERTDAPIDEISWRVGYEDPAFFRRLFKRTTGLAPGAYRKRFRIPDFARP